MLSVIEKIKSINIEDYNYPLLNERIAKYPLAKRDESKLLVNRNGVFSTKIFKDLSNELPTKSLLVFNNTKVIQARMLFQKDTGAHIEIFCLEPLDPNDYQLVFQKTSFCIWKCMVGNLKKWKTEILSKSCLIRGESVELYAEKLKTTGNTHEIKFNWSGENITFADVLEAFGELPIPPYLNRATEESDKTTYQTVYSKIKGSVAAPTAGLHFTDSVLDNLSKVGIEKCELTLHVGAGTFQPVKTEKIGGHQMHTEVIEVPKFAILQIKASLEQVIAVGTTSVRTLESLYYIGLRLSSGNEDLFVSQWEPYMSKSDMPVEDALNAVLNFMDLHGLSVLHASTQIIIAPGYEFKIVKGLITNFHQPKSTLLLLLAAFIGDNWKQMYDYALSGGFRFLSYGDSSLLLKV